MIKARIAVVGLEHRMIRQESLPTIQGSFNCLAMKTDKSSRETIFKIIGCHSILQAEKARKSLKFKYVQHSENNFLYMNQQT